MDTKIGISKAEVRKLQKYALFFSKSSLSTTLRYIAKHSKVAVTYCPVRHDVSRNTFHAIKKKHNFKK
jgi:hypothetical protein